MNAKLTTALVISALLIPVAGYAQDKSVKETVKSAAKSVRENVSDAAITAKIKVDFAKDKQVSALNINVDTDDKGVVTLRGTAKSKAEADKAVSIARSTKGVTSVKNEIKVQAK